MITLPVLAEILGGDFGIEILGAFEGLVWEEVEIDRRSLTLLEVEGRDREAASSESDKEEREERESADPSRTGTVAGIGTTVGEVDTGTGGGVAARRRVEEKRGTAEDEPLVAKGLMSIGVEAKEDVVGSWGIACL